MEQRCGKELPWWFDGQIGSKNKVVGQVEIFVAGVVSAVISPPQHGVARLNML